jgi:hypothetical protein
MARGTDPMSYATVVTYVYLAGIPSGVLRPDDHAMPRFACRVGRSWTGLEVLRYQLRYQLDSSLDTQ